MITLEKGCVLSFLSYPSLHWPSLSFLSLFFSISLLTSSITGFFSSKMPYSPYFPCAASPMSCPSIPNSNEPANGVVPSSPRSLLENGRFLFLICFTMSGN